MKKISFAQGKKQQRLRDSPRNHGCVSAEIRPSKSHRTGSGPERNWAERCTAALVSPGRLRHDRQMTFLAGAVGKPLTIGPGRVCGVCVGGNARGLIPSLARLGPRQGADLYGATSLPAGPRPRGLARRSARPGPARPGRSSNGPPRTLPAAAPGVRPGEKGGGVGEREPTAAGPQALRPSAPRERCQGPAEGRDLGGRPSAAAAPQATPRPRSPRRARRGKGLSPLAHRRHPRGCSHDAPKHRGLAEAREHPRSPRYRNRRAESSTPRPRGHKNTPPPASSRLPPLRPRSLGSRPPLLRPEPEVPRGAAGSCVTAAPPGPAWPRC